MAFGDALLVRGKWEDIERLQNERRNFVVVGSPEAMSRQVIELTPQCGDRCRWLLLGMIV